MHVEIAETPYPDPSTSPLHPAALLAELKTSTSESAHDLPPWRRCSTKAPMFSSIIAHPQQPTSDRTCDEEAHPYQPKIRPPLALDPPNNLVSATLCMRCGADGENGLCRSLVAIVDAGKSPQSPNKRGAMSRTCDQCGAHALAPDPCGSNDTTIASMGPMSGLRRRRFLQGGLGVIPSPVRVVRKGAHPDADGLEVVLRTPAVRALVHVQGQHLRDVGLRAVVLSLLLATGQELSAP